VPEFFEIRKDDECSITHAAGRDQRRLGWVPADRARKPGCHAERNENNLAEPISPRHGVAAVAP